MVKNMGFPLVSHLKTSGISMAIVSFKPRQRHQVMSAMVGTLPDAFTNEFLSLTDHLPVSRIEEVYRIIQRTFRQPPKVERSVECG